MTALYILSVVCTCELPGVQYFRIVQSGDDWREVEARKRFLGKAISTLT